MRPSHMRRSGRTQEQSRPRHIGRLAHAAGGLAGGHGVAEVLEAESGHSGGEEAGEDRVYSGGRGCQYVCIIDKTSGRGGRDVRDMLRTEFDGQRGGEVVHACLAYTICHH